MGRHSSIHDRSRAIDRRDVTETAATVAAAVDLAEGAWGVVDVVRAVARHEPIAVREVSRHVELPVPIVAAICNELRKHGIVDSKRPVRLTEAAREAMAAEAWLDSGRCPTCDGRGLVVPAELSRAGEALERLAERMPGARMELDQAHCTVDTKLRRVMFLSQAGVLGKRTVFLGDDDLTSLAVALVAQLADRPAAPMTVVDVDAGLLDFIAEEAAALGADIEVVHHDAAKPLPAALRESFEVALTDPPYTVAGAELFVSRAVSALQPRPGAHLLF
ncbi:MAG: bis-aminopropyl spermidine synthase family protein, partial [Stackebrandtia sp.]